jgi:hypothetical protein
MLFKYIELSPEFCSGVESPEYLYVLVCARITEYWLLGLQLHYVQLWTHHNMFILYYTLRIYHVYIDYVKV